ncbi:MAG: hypothetical protein U0T32_09375 [Chitinophagales bacterium]
MLPFIFLLLFLQQDAKKQKVPVSITNGYIALRNRDEVKITPLLDTLVAEQEYVFDISFKSKYVFSELFMDKGVAIRTANTLTIKPVNKTNHTDTATLRIIGFSSNNRILLYHQFIVEPIKNLYPRVAKKHTLVLMSNNALERNSSYTKSMFVKDATFEYYEDDLSDTVIVDGLTLSLVSGSVRKNLYTTKPILTKEMHDEIKTLKQNTMAYVRLDVKVGKKRKSTWTRFTIKP